MTEPKRLPRDRVFSSPFGELTALAMLNRDTSRDRVYFIQEGNGGPIKIGWAARVDRRLSQLQPGNPRPLRIAGTMPGGVKEERELHRKFKDTRLYGEWFAPSAELLIYIQENCPDWEGGAQ
jgi:hypothetical protein